MKTLGNSLKISLIAALVMTGFVSSAQAATYNSGAALNINNQALQVFSDSSANTSSPNNSYLFSDALHSTADFSVAGNTFANSKNLTGSAGGIGVFNVSTTQSIFEQYKNFDAFAVDIAVPISLQGSLQSFISNLQNEYRNYAYARYSIYVNGTNVWNSFAQAFQMSQIVVSGENLGYIVRDGNYETTIFDGAFSSAVDLGLLRPQETANIEYRVTLGAFGEQTGNFKTSFGGYLCSQGEFDLDCPNGAKATANFSVGALIATSTVPELQAWLMLLIGLAALAYEVKPFLPNRIKVM